MAAFIKFRSTTEPARLEYDATHYTQVLSKSTGGIEFKATGGSSSSRDVIFRKENNTLAGVAVYGTGNGRTMEWHSTTASTQPNIYLSDGCALKTTAWVVISGSYNPAFPTDFIYSPGYGKSMLDVWSDVDDAAIHVRQSADDLSTHGTDGVLMSFITDGDGTVAGGSHKLNILASGKLAWGSIATGSWRTSAQGGTRAALADIADTYLGRDSAARLLLTGEADDIAGFIAENTSTGTGALSRVQVKNDAGVTFDFEIFSSTYATAARQSNAMLETSGNKIFVRSVTGVLDVQTSAGAAGKLYGGVEINGFLNMGGVSGAGLTIASGAVTATRSYHQIDTEASAATDDLDTINGGTVGDLMVLQANTSTRTVVVKNGTGNISLNGSDFSMDNSQDRILLMRATSTWVEIARSNNGA